MPLKIPIHSFTEDGLDRKSLTTLKKRFMAINKGRLERTESALPERQRIFLKLLPLLFHVNHPMIPGFVSRITPSGVALYKPTRQTLKEMQRYTKSFTLNRSTQPRQDILGIYIMGSCGTIAHSNKSDLDIWICYKHDLTTDLIEQLKKKCALLTDWAATLGLEAHFFPLNPQKFKQGEQQPLSVESSGSAQHYLLLDEFYRTGLHIAGATPLWWYIPAQAESRYEEFSHELLSKRFIKATDIIDFGSVANIPAGEFIGASIWQLYKGIDSPYKSVLKLLLTEAYASEYPQTISLSLTYKQAVFNGEDNINQLDPYVQLYKKLESYLQQKREFSRLELVRRCFYFKINQQISRPASSMSKSWRWLLLEELVKQWDWQTALLHNLDTRHQWKVGNVIAERKELVHELNHSYRFLSSFAKEIGITASISAQEMSILGRKLYAAFERRAGKIELINPGIANNLEEEELFITITQNPCGDNMEYWQLVLDRPLDSKHNPAKRLKQSRSLVELLVWSHVNGLIGSTTRLNIIKQKNDVSEYELHNILSSLQQLIPTPLPQLAHENFQQSPKNHRIILFINMGIDPLADTHSKGIHRISHKTDALAYSGLKENLIHTIDKVTINSWGEITTRHYHQDALIHCLTHYMNTHLPSPATILPKLNIFCFSSNQSGAIIQRVENLFREIISCFYSGARPVNTRYIFSRKDAYHTIQFDDGKATVTQYNHKKELINSLGLPQKEFSPIVIDPYALQGHVLRAICKNTIRGALQIYFEEQGDEAEIYISDEKCSLVRFRTAFHDQPTLLNPLKRFIQSMLYRQNTAMDENNLSPVHRNVSFYEIIPTNDNLHYQIERRKDLESANSDAYFTVQAIADFDEDNNIIFNIFCHPAEFEAADYGDAIYKNVAQYILSQRATNQPYPCYITDIDLSRLSTAQYRNGATQTCLYLRYKIQIEQSINTALQRLSRHPQ